MLGLFVFLWDVVNSWTLHMLPSLSVHFYLLAMCILPLDVDSINENDSVANPDPTPRIASVHKSRIAEVVLVGCWMEAVYYGLLLFTIM